MSIEQELFLAIFILGLPAFIVGLGVPPSLSKVTATISSITAYLQTTLSDSSSAGTKLSILRALKNGFAMIFYTLVVMVMVAVVFTSASWLGLDIQLNILGMMTVKKVDIVGWEKSPTRPKGTSPAIPKSVDTATATPDRVDTTIATPECVNAIHRLIIVWATKTILEFYHSGTGKKKTEISK